MKVQKTIYSIQELRAIAAAMVVIFHTFNHLYARNLIPEVPGIINVGRAGVDIFFVISGFIMVWISDSKFGKPGASKDFFIKRIIRVVPTYWIYTLLMTALMLAFPHLVSHGKTVSFQHLLASLFFIPWENNLAYIKPVLSVGWTLNYEMYFYALFGVLLFLRKVYFLPLLSVILLLGIVTGFVLENIPPSLDISTSPLLLEFLMGCTIAVYFKKNPNIPCAYVTVMLLTGVCALIATGLIETPGLPRVVKWGIPSALIVASTILLEKAELIRPIPLLSALGDSSYSLYLSHIFTISAVGKLWAEIFGSMYGVFTIFAIITSIIAGHIAYLLIEKPIIEHLNKM